MKATKYLFVIISLFALCFLFGCSDNNAGVPKEVTDKIEEVHKYIRNNYSHSLANDVTLISEYEGATIFWVSSDASVVDNTGKIVNRPQATTNVPFTYAITYQGVTKEFAFSFDVSSMTLEQAKAELLALNGIEVSEEFELPLAFANGAIDVVYESNDLSVICECGYYYQPAVTKEVKVKFELSDGHNKVKGEFTFKAIGKTVDERITETYEWLISGGIGDLYLTSESVLPTYYDKAATEIEWSCSAKDVLNKDHVKQFVYERFITLYVRIFTESKYEEYKFNASIAPLDTTNMSKQEIIENFVSTIAVSNYNKLTFNQATVKNQNLQPYEYDKISQSYGFLSFYDSANCTVVEQIAPLDSVSGHDNRPGTKKPSIEYVCIHDTAWMNASAQALANYVATGGGGTSWHYTVDDLGAYHQIPNDEVAYHAGDSTKRFFGLIDTGVLATAKKPVLSFKEGYFYINGIKTEVSPFYMESDNKETRYLIDCNMNELGVVCEIGENGNYFLGKTYFNTTYKYIANYGGNTGSIGIETCLSNSRDYAKTARNVAKLAAELCIEYNLTVDRVKGHHYFSGKPCPNAILLAEWWGNLLDLVSLEKFAKENLTAYTFEYVPVTSNIDAKGYISLDSKAGDIVKYTIIVKEGNTELLNKTYETVLN